MGNGINKIYKHLKYESGVDAVSSISGVFYLVMLNNSKWERYLKREHSDFHSALLRQLVACRQQHIFVSDKGRYETPKEKYKVCVNDGSWLIFHPRRKGGKRVHIKNMKKDYRKCIRSYASFLRADGVDNVDEMLYYILHYTYYHISFYRGLKITYDKTKPIIDEVIKWIMKKDIEKVDKSEFIDPRKMAAPNEICNGCIRKARKSEKISVVRKTKKLLTDKEIAAKYNPDLTIAENCANIGIKPTRLKQWKRENADSIESIEDKVKRLYNPELSWIKNKEIIGCSINTIKKYINQAESIAVDEIVELNTVEYETQVEECLDIDNDDNCITMEESIEVNNFGTTELDTVDNEFISWVMESDFTEEVEKENADSDKSIEHKEKKAEPIVIDIETTELDTADSDNQFEGRLDIDNDDYCRWLFGDEFMENIEREKEINARLYGTDDAVKMVV